MEESPVQNRLLLSNCLEELLSKKPKLSMELRPRKPFPSKPNKKIQKPIHRHYNHRKDHEVVLSEAQKQLILDISKAKEAMVDQYRQFVNQTLNFSTNHPQDEVNYYDETRIERKFYKKENVLNSLDQEENVHQKEQKASPIKQNSKALEINSFENSFSITRKASSIQTLINENNNADEMNASTFNKSNLSTKIIQMHEDRKSQENDDHPTTIAGYEELLLNTYPVGIDKVEYPIKTGSLYLKENQESFEREGRNYIRSSNDKCAQIKQNRPGHYSKGDKPLKITNMEFDKTRDLLFTIEWKQGGNKDLKVESSNITRQELLKYDPLLLLYFYENHLDFSNAQSFDPKKLVKIPE